MATLLLTLGDRELQRLPITKIRTWVGRDHGCDLVIDNEAISRRHARIEYRDRGWVLFDNDSDNGVWVAGSRRARVDLVDGAAVGLGKFTVTFLASGGAPPDTLRSVPFVDEPAELDNLPTTHLAPEYIAKVRRSLEERDRQRALGSEPTLIGADVPTRPPPRGVPGVVLLAMGVMIGALVVLILVLLLGSCGAGG